MVPFPAKVLKILAADLESDSAIAGADGTMPADIDSDDGVCQITILMLCSL